MTGQTEERATPTPAPIATAQPPMPPSDAKPPASKGRGRAFLIFFVVLALIAIGATIYWLNARQFESTDDAQVDAHLNPVTARIDGTITKVYADDNQAVKAGQELVDLDPRDNQVALDEALAQVAQARSMVVAQQPNIPITQVENFTSISNGEAEVANAKAAQAGAERDRETAAARLAEAEANYAKAQADLERYKILIAKEEVSQQEFDQVSAAAKAQTAVLAASKSSLESAARMVDMRGAQADEALARLAQYRRTAPQQLALRRAAVESEQLSAKTYQTQVEQAQLNLSYCRIAAPVSGIVMKRSAEVGSHIAAGQQLMTIAQVDDVWVTANFKETQLHNVRPSQAARIHVDALNRDFDGYVENVGASTGAVGSVLPPENATGNYVKVVQRIPVRLRFKKDQKGLENLRPGMSVEPEVRIGG